MRVLGVEPAKQIAKIANDNGIETYPYYFSKTTVDKIISSHGKANLITSNNVFANIDDIRTWVSCVERLLEMMEYIYLKVITYLI